MITFSEEEIAALVRDSQEGDRDAFGRLYDHFVKKIFNYIYFRTYRKDLAEDIVSQTFLKALEKLHSYKPEKGALSAWLYRIAHNTLMDHYRQRKGTVNIDDVWDIPGDRNVEVDAENRLGWEKLKPLLEQLSARERDIILMRVWDEMSYREIGEIVGSSEASCKMAYSRAVKALRKVMPALFALLVGPRWSGRFL
jgi:RNA polymerase sigma-70 factor, ECF subfamily